MTQREVAEQIHRQLLRDQEDGETEEASVLLLMDALKEYAETVRQSQRETDANLADQWEGIVAAQIADAIRGKEPPKLVGFGDSITYPDPI